MTGKPVLPAGFDGVVVITRNPHGMRYLTGPRREELLRVYRDRLHDDVVPFWLKHGLDREHGGIITALGRDGEILDTDKSVWFQGRAAWMFATLHNTTPGAPPAWLEAALSCACFLRDRCASPEGKLWFTVTREGRPLRMRRYAYSESFAAIAYAAVHKAVGDDDWKRRAIAAFETYLHHNFTPGVMAPKYEPTRPALSIGPLMIGVATAQELRENLGDLVVSGASLSEHVARMIGDIETYFVKRDIGAVMETVAPDGGLIDHFDGRLLNPGHAIEAAWFILREARRNGNAAWKRLGLDMIDMMWERGRDKVHGGLFYFTDVSGKPIQEYWHHMKFWWPHNEAVIAALLAYVMTGDAKYAAMHREIHDWTYSRFPDPDHGEWFGYLDREGRPTTELKGNMWKGPFHMPRMKWYCARLLDESAGDDTL